MKTIIAGSRSISDDTLIREAIEESRFIITEIVCGEAKGVDILGKLWGSLHKIPVKSFPASWHKFGLTAGFNRNTQMAEYADALIAVWDGESRGTLDMITQMRLLKKPVYVKVVNCDNKS